MLMTCPAGEHALPLVHAASAADVAGNAPLDRVPVVTPVGTPRCKNAGTPAPASLRTTCSNRADRTYAPENLRSPRLGAGPRTPLSRQLTPPPARDAAADNADLALADAPDPVASPASAGRPAIAATDTLPADTPHCNSGSGGATADTIVRSPSADIAAADHDNRLVLDLTKEDTEVGPRERELPGSSLEAELTTPLRGVLFGTSGCVPQLNLGFEWRPERTAPRQ